MTGAKAIWVFRKRAMRLLTFARLAERYERRSLIITSNLVFGEWDRIFKNPMTTAAAIDRLVHHSAILEFSGRSKRADEAESRTKPGHIEARP